TPSSWRACWASSYGRSAADRLPPQTLARCRIEKVHGLAIGGDTRSGVARRRGDRNGDRCRADAAVNEPRGAELLDEVLGESELAITARPETQILGADAHLDFLAVRHRERVGDEADAPAAG